VLLLGFTVLELAVIHDAAHGGLGCRRDLHEIEFGGLSLGQRLGDGNDAELLAFNANKSNFRRIDLAVKSLLLLVECYVRDSCE
jgi:hypothetical protein